MDWLSQGISVEVDGGAITALVVDGEAMECIGTTLGIWVLKGGKLCKG